MDDSQAGYMNEEQVKALYLNAAIKAKENGFDLIDVILKMNSLDIFPQLYKPLDKLHGLIEIYRQWCINLEEAQKARDQERVKDLKRSAGNLLEELVFLAFISLRGFETAKSFRSFSAQHDLVISGKVGAWEILLNLLNLNPTHKTF